MTADDLGPEGRRAWMIASEHVEQLLDADRSADAVYGFDCAVVCELLRIAFYVFRDVGVSHGGTLLGVVRGSR